MRNLRHLRVFLAVVQTGSVTRAAKECHVTQPAVTQALTKLESESGGPLLERSRTAFVPNERGSLLVRRVQRALRLLDEGLLQISPRLILTATSSQLRALVAVRDAENISRAARALGLAQPTVQRAITQLEQEAARPLFERTSYGLVPTRPCQKLAQAVHLAFSELDQGEAELAELDGKVATQIVVGALPLSRSAILPKALKAFRAARPHHPVIILDGPYEEMLGGLRRGEIDLIIGALRDPLPAPDIVQEHLFDDRLAIVAGRHHRLAGQDKVPVSELVASNWLVPRKGTPTRHQFDALFTGHEQPQNIIETGSILLMRELLCDSDDLGCISSAQAEAEISKSLLAEVRTDVEWPKRPIGLTYRASWMPTAIQSFFLDLVRRLKA